MMAGTPYRVALFARNEARNLPAAIAALIGACPPGSDLRITVLINGCTDSTPDVVRSLAASHAQVTGVLLPFGDKSNAWNTYVYEIADASSVHFFTDGDVTCSPGALERMQETLLQSEGAAAIAGMPLAGRHQEQYRRHIREWHWLFGNLYAVRHDQLARIRSAGARLPIGLAGSDHFVSKLMAARTIRPTSLDWNQNIHRDDAGFMFHSLQPFRPRDWRIYRNRRVTYALRQRQIPLLDSLDLSDLPRTMDAVNRGILADLEVEGPRSFWERGVRSRLRRMYPAPAAIWFERLADQANRWSALT